MPSIALQRHDVIVGVDTHKDKHIAVAIDGLGGPTFTNEVQHRYAAELRWESIMDSSILTSG